MQRTLAPLALATLALACAAESGDAPDPDDQADGKADEADGELTEAACLQQAVFPSAVLADALDGVPGAIDDSGAPVIPNYTAWPIYDPTARTARMDPEVTRRISDPDEALQNIASRFGTCRADITAHVERTHPNVYIYFTGFGGADQNNSLIEQGAVMRWIGERDPSALIFSINWNCAAEEDPFCAANTQAIASTEDSPHVRSMNRAIDVVVPQLPGGEQLVPQLKGAIAGFGQQQAGYDSAMSHSIQLAAKLIDQILVADNGEGRFGDIRIAGYSMGAHSAAQVLVQDFTGDGGFAWTRDGVCPDGGSVCTVAELDKVKWSLSMGLSGWAHAMKDFDRTDRDQYENGGLFRVEDDAYRGKLAVLNRRMDPTGNSDDTFQRGFLDIFYGDYNHYSHDYDLPLFIDEGFKRGLDAFLESSSMASSREIGIVFDNASLVDFDTCPADGECDAPTGYIAHEANRSHAVLDVPRVAVKTVGGVEHEDRVNNRAATFGDRGGSPIALRTFDQEDLRGGVELYLRPHFDPAGDGLHGLFSYGGCKESDEELMPTAFFEDGLLAFQMMYEGETFRVEVKAEEAGIERGEWTHLAFTWELPVESLTVQHDNANDLLAQLPGMLPDLQEHKVALVLASGLTKPLATTYKRQAGEGTMRIYVNGEPVEAPLGTLDSARECMAADDVLASERYDVNGETFPPFAPYARYTRESGDVVAFSPEQVLGTKCKAYRVRNTQAFFGCAQSDEVNADADMDDITLVWGPGRTEYENIDHETGEPLTWPLGVEYDATPLRL